MKYDDCKPGDVIPVIIEGKLYETVIDEHGTQRFRSNTVLDYMREHDTHGKPAAMHHQMFNLNTLAVAFHMGKFDKRDYMELVMQGYSVSGFCDLSTFADWTISNPLWDDGEPSRIGGQLEEDEE